MCIFQESEVQESGIQKIRHIRNVRSTRNNNESIYNNKGEVLCNLNYLYFSHSL
jgi:hypothetical protein